MARITLPSPLSPFQKLKPTDPCWCKSGKPFVACHSERSAARKANPNEVLDLLRKSFKKTIGCLHPEATAKCAGKIIASHTIQRSGPLKAIAKNGEVYSVRGSAKDIVKNNGSLIPRKEGTSVVSTFPGFCAKHDNEFFSPVENGDFELNNYHAFLFLFRNVCYEYHAKVRMAFGDDIRSILDAGKDTISQAVAQQNASDMNFGAGLAQDELKELRDTLIQSNLQNDYSLIKSVYIEYEGTAPFATSFAGTPKFSLNGKIIQEWSDERLKQVSVTSISRGSHSGFLLSFVDDEIGNIIRSELTAESPPSISRLFCWIIANADNVYYNIDWWDNLSSARRKYIDKLATIGVGLMNDSEELMAFDQHLEVLRPLKCSSVLEF